MAECNMYPTARGRWGWSRFHFHDPEAIGRLMLSLDKVVAGAKVRGLAGAAPVEVVRTEWIGSDALNVVYRGADGPAEVLLGS
jgi:hypothetical protein